MDLRYGVPVRSINVTFWEFARDRHLIWRGCYSNPQAEVQGQAADNRLGVVWEIRSSRLFLLIESKQDNASVARGRLGRGLYRLAGTLVFLGDFFDMLISWNQKRPYEGLWVVL